MTPSAVAIVGCASVDVLVRDVDQLPAAGTDSLVDEVSVRAAGPVLNTAFVLHALDDGPARCFTALGDDALGHLIVGECAQRGVPADGIELRGDARTAVSVAVESRTRQRSFLTDLGAAAHFDASGMPEVLADYTDVLVTGYFVAPALRGESTATLLRRAHRDGARTWLDCGWDPDSWTTGGAAEVFDLLPDVDIFVPNTDEVEALTGTDDPVRGGRLLAEHVRGGVIVKAGPDGAYWITGHDDPVHVPAPAIDVIDTTGAGDALNAGVMTGLRRHWSMSDALELGVRTASEVVSRTSTRRWEPIAL